jgi:hypothetical protein
MKLLAGIALMGFGTTPAVSQVVFESTFDGALPTQVQAGTAALTGVQGYAGLGLPGRQFGGSFLRSATGNTVRMTLTNLPAHDRVSIDFLFAAIDSLDGTGTFPEGDFLRVTVDGVTIFRESFANATDTQDQTYVGPPGVTLARRVDLGFSQGFFYFDSAYDLGRDPRFQAIPHSSSTLVVEWLIEGPGIQDLGDESWAMDNLRIVLGSGPVCDGVDFNNDGSSFDPTDIDAFLSVFSEGPCIPASATCNDVDFTNDGSLFDPCDVDSFLLVFSEGPCTLCGV